MQGQEDLPKDLGEPGATSRARSVQGQMGVLGRFATWLIDTYFPDAFVPREDFDHVQNREFPIIQRDMSRLRAHLDYRNREYDKLKRDAFYSVGFLSKLDDPVNGQVAIETTINWQRDRFCHRVACEMSDDWIRRTTRRLTPQLLDHISEDFKRHIRRQLERHLTGNETGSADASFSQKQEPQSLSAVQGQNRL